MYDQINEKMKQFGVLSVVYKGCSAEQASWGNNDNPKNVLVVGNTYTVDEIEEHSWHTKYVLQGFPNLKFNSVCFEEV